MVIVDVPESRGGWLSATGCRAGVGVGAGAGAGAAAAAGARAIGGAVNAAARGRRRDVKYVRGWRRLGLGGHWRAQMEPLKVGGWRVSDSWCSTTHFIFWGRSFGRCRLGRESDTKMD